MKKHRWPRKVLAGLLVIALVASFMPQGAFFVNAQTAEPEQTVTETDVTEEVLSEIQEQIATETDAIEELPEESEPVSSDEDNTEEVLPEDTETDEPDIADESENEEEVDEQVTEEETDEEAFLSDDSVTELKLT